MPVSNLPKYTHTVTEVVHTCLLALRQLVDVLRAVFVLDDLDLVDVVELPARVQLLDLPLDALVARLLDLPEHLHVAVHGQRLAGLQNLIEAVHEKRQLEGRLDEIGCILNHNCHVRNQSLMCRSFIF